MENIRTSQVDGVGGLVKHGDNNDNGRTSISIQLTRGETGPRIQTRETDVREGERARDNSGDREAEQRRYMVR